MILNGPCGPVTSTDIVGSVCDRIGTAVSAFGSQLAGLNRISVTAES
jgi:hypothetical protein